MVFIAAPSVRRDSACYRAEAANAAFLEERSMTERTRKILAAAALIVAAGALSACSHDASRAEGQSRLGDSASGGHGLFKGGSKKGGDAGIGVNSFLWRASLDTLNFMPLVSADPFGGVIITDWYTNPEKPNERFKATVYILDTRLRADAIKVSIFKQQLTANGWSDAPTDVETGIQIENAILTKARQYKLSTIG
jgi:hypothetical protein